jgi:hypothetical protein
MQGVGTWLDIGPLPYMPVAAGFYWPGLKEPNGRCHDAQLERQHSALQIRHASWRERSEGVLRRLNWHVTKPTLASASDLNANGLVAWFVASSMVTLDCATALSPVAARVASTRLTRFLVNSSPLVAAVLLAAHSGLMPAFLIKSAQRA